MPQNDTQFKPGDKVEYLFCTRPEWWKQGIVVNVWDSLRMAKIKHIISGSYSNEVFEHMRPIETPETKR